MSGSMGAVAAPADFGGIGPGLREPVLGAQQAFRAVLDAIAHPGRIVELEGLLAGAAPAPLGEAAAAVALTLCDLDTPVWLDDASSPVRGYLSFHCGSPVVEIPDAARFAFIADALELPPLERFALGTDEYPERAATLLIAADDLTERSGVLLRGPGIRGEARLGVAGLPARFWTERQALAELFPRGLDLLFTCGARLAAVPRSTQAVA
jgi:alpha-D-ribose 1-methylphosphonate 5-triphosphate synthase subunit PhnH